MVRLFDSSFLRVFLDFSGIFCENIFAVFHCILTNKGEVMQFKRILTLALGLSLSLVLAACGGGGDAGGGDAGGGAAVALPESVSVTDAFGGTVNASHPEGWTATATDGTGSIILVGDATAAQNVNIVFVTPDMVSVMAAGAETPADLLNAMSEAAMASAPAGVTVGEVVETTINGNTAATMTASGEGMTLMMVAVQIEGGFAFVTGTSADSAGDFAATVQAIAGSVTYTPAG